MLASSGTTRTHTVNGVPGDFSTAINRVLRAKLADSVSLLPCGFLKSGIYRILGAHKPYRHDQAVPHRCGGLAGML